MSIRFSAVNATLIVVLFMVGAVYLIQINALATKGYEIKALEQRITDLRQENDDLELEMLSLQSMGAIKAKVDSLGMVAVTDTDYLTISPVAAAR